MGFILAMVLIWLVFVRWGTWSRYAYARTLYLDPDRLHVGRCTRSQRNARADAMWSYPARRAATEEAAIELLKRRYVAGELTDEQYEDELDALFRTTSIRGRA